MADFYGRMKAERVVKRLGLYRVLQTNLMSEADREKASAVAATILTPADAYKLAGHDKFTYFDMDRNGFVGAVRWNQVPVRILIKRNVTEVEYVPGDPIPERTITDPADAWIQIDLIGLDREVQDKGIVQRFKNALERIANLEVLVESEKSDYVKLTEQAKKLEEQVRDLPGLKEKIGLVEKQLRIATVELEAALASVKVEKQRKVEDKANMVRELFPVMNTLWLAGVHRVNDTLYDAIKKQMTGALEKIGVELVEPKIGDEFNPYLHHAIHSYPYPRGSSEIGAIVKVHQVGWKLADGAVQEAAVVSVGMEDPATMPAPEPEPTQEVSQNN